MPTFADIAQMRGEGSVVADPSYPGGWRPLSGIANSQRTLPLTDSSSSSAKQIHNNSNWGAGLGVAGGVIGSVIPGVGTAAGAAIGGVVGGAIDANNAAEASADKAMAFSERMSNSSYQRGMIDMRLAGLNPILAYSQGGASSPSGVTYTPQNVMEKGASTAMDAFRTAATVAGTQASISNTAQDTLLKKQQVLATDAQAQSSLATAKQATAAAAKTAAELPEGRLRGRVSDMIDKGLSAVGSATGAAADFGVDHVYPLFSGSTGLSVERTNKPIITPIRRAK